MDFKPAFPSGWKGNATNFAAKMTVGDEYEHLTGRPHKIGVFDYDSLRDLIHHEHERLLPQNTTADPQGQLQEIVGLTMDLRRKLERMTSQAHAAAMIAARYGVELRTEKEQKQ